MAHTVSSAVVQETISQVLYNLVQKYDEKEESNAKINLERLEMAHIRLEAALETSGEWQITNAALLRWRRKLKRAAQECNDTVQRCKQRILEDEETENEVRKSSFPKRIAHTTKFFVSSIFSPNKDESNRSAVRRFEWFADGASDFLRLVELGGTPCRHVPFDPLTSHLLAGKKLQHKIIQANKGHLSLLLAPFITEEYGIEARLIFMQKDGNVPEDDFLLTLIIQLSESTDIIGIAIKCLQLYSPLFKSTVERIRKELMRLPTEDFSWLPYVDTHHREHWDNLHSFCTLWFRPNPLCCKQHNQHKLYHGSKLDMSGLQHVSLEPVIEVNLQCHVLLSETNKQRALLSESKNSIEGSSFLKAGLLFTPHGCPEDRACATEDILPVDRSPAIQSIYSEEQQCLYTDFTWAQLDEIVLPKAIDYFCKNDEATIYKILWRFKHGTLYFHVEMESIFMQSTRRTLQGKPEGSGNWENAVYHFVNLWALHAPIQQQHSIKDWIQKEKELQLLGEPPVHLSL